MVYIEHGLASLLFRMILGKNEEKSALIFGKVSVKNRRFKVGTSVFPCFRGKNPIYSFRKVGVPPLESPTPTLSPPFFVAKPPVIEFKGLFLEIRGSISAFYSIVF